MNNQQKAISIFLYLLWPFSAVIIGLKNFDSSFGRKLLIGAFAFLGYTALDTGDLERYATQYYEISNMSLDELFNLFVNLQISKLFNDVTAILFSPFENHHVYFAFLFGFFGYFLINTINMLRFRVLKKSNLPILISFIVFATFYSVLTIFNYAFYTGAIYFLYFLIKIILYKKKSSYFWIVLTPLFHLGLMPLLLVPLLFLLFKQKTYLYILVLFIFTIISQTTVSNVLEGYLGDSDTILENKYNAYGSTEGKERMEERYSKGYEQGNINYRLFRDVRDITFKIAIPILLSILYLNRKIIKNNKVLLNLLNLSICAMSITQLLLNISQGERFYFISGFMVLATLVFFIQIYGYHLLRFRYLVNIIVCMFLLNNLISLVMVKNLISSDFLISNFPLLFFKLL